MSSSNPATESALKTLGTVVAVGVLLSIVTIAPAGGNGGLTTAAPVPGDAVVANEVAGASAGSGAASAAGGTAATAAGSGVGPATAAGAPGGQPVAANPARPGGGPAAATCAAGRNGGATDIGVTPTQIKLGATVVDDGPGASFLGPVRIGMAAVANRVNKAGGICGRRLDLKLRNDSWEAATGKRFIQNFVESEKVFALAVVPSSEGLRAADSYVAEKKVPVVGTDGMLIHQYQNPWIWPVATSTISTMHVMAKTAHDRGARRFSIVFDAKYRFGVEGAFAFNQSVKRLTGESIPGFDDSLKGCTLRFCGIQPGASSYATFANQFKHECFDEAHQGGACDFTAFLLEPDTAISWFNDYKQTFAARGGAQPLFTRDFAEACKQTCDKMEVWTGYRPALGSFAGEPAAAAYISAVRGESSSADVENQFLQGGYLGMTLLVDALTRTGGDLTRDRLRQVLDSTTLDSGLSRPLTWRSGNHFANTAAIPFTIDYKQSFNGFRNTSNGAFIVDPWVGQDIRSEG